MVPPVLSGGLLLDKPSGVTSARAVSRVKRLLPKGTRVGHTGTLDPLASGLLVLMIGRATRLSRYVTELDKTYTATARFGATSTTLDAEGEISEVDAVTPHEGAVRSALSEFTGALQQVPPMASAVKVGGERLYRLHRRGESVEREPRRVEIRTFKLDSLDAGARTATFTVSCSSGTYVRTLISDLACYLGTGAYLIGLRRTSVGHLHLKDAARPDDLTDEGLVGRIIPPGAVVSHLPVANVDDRGLLDVRHGRNLPLGEFEGSFRVEAGGELLAIYRDGGGAARPEVVLCAG